MFWKKSHSKLVSAPDFEDNNEYLLQKKRLFETPLYVPNRNEIELPNDDDGLGWASGLKERRWAFKYFDKFDDWVNRLHKEGEAYDIGPWRVEQCSDPYLSSFGIDDGPVIGLRFRVYYNSEQVGDVEIHPFSEPSSESGRDELDYEVGLSVKIFPAPFLPHDHLSSFLFACSERLTSAGTGPSKYTSVVSALTATLWEANRRDSMWTGLEFIYYGTVRIGRDYQ